MPDTAIAVGITSDAEPRLKLTNAAIERAKRKLGVDTIDQLADRLGFSRQTFWRLRKGEYDIRLSEATAIAEQIDWPITRAFERVARG